MTAKRTQSATSSAVSGVSPSYTFAARCSSPPKRTTLNSVSTIPGSISVTRTGFPSSSMRSVSVIARTPCFALV